MEGETDEAKIDTAEGEDVVFDDELPSDEDLDTVSQSTDATTDAPASDS